MSTTKTSDVEKAFALSLSVIILLLIVPYLSYYVYKFHSHRKNPMIYKRHYGINTTFSILLMISLIGDKSLFMISLIINDTVRDAEATLLYQISDWVYFLVGPTILITMLLALWILFYEITWTLVTNPNDKWTHFIDPNYDKHNSHFVENNWFIQKQATFGNAKWITKYIIVPILCVIYLSLFFSQFVNATIHYFVFVTWLCIISFFIILIRSKFPKEKIEIFHIEKTLNRMLQFGASFSVCFVIYIIGKNYLKSISSQFEVDFILFFQFLFTFHYFLGGITTTRYVLRECNLMHTASSKQELSLIASIGSSLKLDIESPKTLSSASSNSYLSLSRILSQKLSFYAFMSHLMKEFSSECLLCILECFQFKKMIKTLNDKRKSQNISESLADSEGDLTNFVGFHDILAENETFFDFNLPQKNEVPQSVIVYDKECNIEKRAQRLIEKYVYSANGNCVFEINISSSCKYEMIQKAAALDERVFDLQQLYDLFDGVLIELLGLLRGSHSRFMRTDEYKQLIAHVVLDDDADDHD